jgi:hypothetical protein
VISEDILDRSGAFHDINFLKRARARNSATATAGLDFFNMDAISASE